MKMDFPTLFYLSLICLVTAELGTSKFSPLLPRSSLVARKEASTSRSCARVEAAGSDSGITRSGRRWRTRASTCSTVQYSIVQYTLQYSTEYSTGPHLGEAGVAAVAHAGGGARHGEAGVLARGLQLGHAGAGEVRGPGGHDAHLQQAAVPPHHLTLTSALTSNCPPWQGRDRWLSLCCAEERHAWIQGARLGSGLVQAGVMVIIALVIMSDTENWGL